MGNAKGLSNETLASIGVCGISKKEIEIDYKDFDDGDFVMTVDMGDEEEEIQAKQEKALADFKGELTDEILEKIKKQVEEQVREEHLKSMKEIEVEREKLVEKEIEFDLHRVGQLGLELEGEIESGVNKKTGSLEIYDDAPVQTVPKLEILDPALQGHELKDKYNLTNQTLNNHGTINQQPPAAPAQVVVNNFIGQQPVEEKEEKKENIKKVSIIKQITRELVKIISWFKRLLVKIIAFILVTAILTFVVNVLFPELVPIIKDMLIKAGQWIANRINEFTASR